MTSEVVVRAEHLTKIYKIFDRPVDRLKEALHPFHKRYSHDFYALKDVSFDVFKGENIGFVGKNGAGKSTLLKIITGVLTASEGSVTVKGTVASLLELGAGFNLEMTGIENIYLNGTIMGLSQAETDARLDDIVAFADIGEFVYQPVKMYSSGMFARLAFAVNAFAKPDVLIVDEALSVGDSRFQIKCMKKMQDLMEGGTAILFVTHDINAVRRFCDRAFWLDHGQLKSGGDANKVVDAYVEHLKLEEVKPVETKERKKVQPATPATNFMAEITEVSLLDDDGQETDDEFTFDMPLTVKVVYDVRDENIEQPVLGIAVRSAAEEYLCGLNTLLDKQKIPWRLGKNEMYLTYPYGIRLSPGHYHFDMALFDETATVPIQFVSRIKDFTVASEYKAEGSVIIPHQWKTKR